jgi:uncharacterized protein (DUF488 family)
MSPMPRALVFSIGHGTRPIEEFLALLRHTSVEFLVDVRAFPGSRKHPQFGKDALATALHSEGIAYEWKKELGGFRKPRPDSRHTALRSAGFRGYANHMETEEFRAAREWLIVRAAESRTAIMCAESLWWRCHRQMLADALVAVGCKVRHIMGGGRTDEHRLHPAARLDDGTLVYDQTAAQARLID